MADLDRRQFLIATTAGLTALAGCTDTGEDEQSQPESLEETGEEETEPGPEEEEGDEELNITQDTPEDTATGFVKSIANDNITAYNKVVHDVVEADSMTDVMGSFRTFPFHFEAESDDISIESIEIDEITEVDVETMVRDIREEEVEEFIQQGKNQIKEVEENHGFADSAIVYTSYQASGVEIEDYLLVVKNQEAWLVFDSLVY